MKDLLPARLLNTDAASLRDGGSVRPHDETTRKSVDSFCLGSTRVRTSSYSRGMHRRSLFFPPTAAFTFTLTSVRGFLEESGELKPNQNSCSFTGGHLRAAVAQVPK